MGAISTVFLALCSTGDRIAAVRQLYGGSYSVLSSLLPRYGIETTFVDVDREHGLEEAVAGAKFLYCETIGNPRVQVADLPQLASVAHAAGIPFIVDNTFASPVLCRPGEHGADLVIHSATKFIGGHHDLLGGIVCGASEDLEPIKELNRELGNSLSPFNAWLCLRALATLPLRIERASATSLLVAQALAQHPDIDAVYYPALEGNPSKPLADKLLGGRGGATLGFDVAGGKERAARFQEHLKVIQRAASLGGTHSLIVHAASVTHTQLSPEELIAAGISEGFCRLSIGLEDPSDLIDDLESALKASL
jgi:cystathionine beta-lyase/cystathionine gamma-synthase